MEEHIGDRMSPKEAAELIGVHVKTLWEWSKKGYGPTKYQTGIRKAYYLRSDVDSYIENNTHAVEPEPEAANG